MSFEKKYRGLSSCPWRSQMRRRGKVPKGFRADDEKVLQMEFNREHEEFVMRMKKERLENRERVKKQAVMQRRRLMLEHQLREEQEEAANDHRLDFWLSLVSPTTVIHLTRLPLALRTLYGL
eukprot:22180-Eustigmatos_ZCMA.PRE.1